MQITLYKYGLDNLICNKKNLLIDELNLECYLKNETNLTTPTITLNYTLDNLFNFNYCYIPKFNRYYFIINFKINSNNTLDLFLKVDVLFSNYDNYKSENFNIVRKNTTNLIYKDNNMKFTYTPTLRDLSSYYTGENSFYTQPQYDTSNVYYFVKVINENDISIISQNTTQENLPNIYQAFTGIPQNNIYVINANLLIQLQEKILDNDILNSYIKSIVVLPINIPLVYKDLLQEIDTKQITLGKNIIEFNISSSYDKVYKWLGSDILSFKLGTFNISSFINDYYNYAPYTNIYLYLPFVNDIINVNLNYCTSKVNIIYRYDFNSNSSSVILYNDIDNYILYQNHSSLGVNITLDSTNEKEINDLKNRQILNTTLSSINGALSSASKFISGDIVGGGLGVVSTTNEVLKGINSLSMLYNKANVGGVSDSTSLGNPLNTMLFLETYVPQNFDFTNYILLNGVPTNEINSINQLQSGYIQLDNVIFKNTYFITNEEKQELKQILESGFYKY